MLRPKMNLTQQKWHERMKKEHRCFRKFINSLNSVKSQQSYGYLFQKFMRFCVAEQHTTNPEAFEELLEFDSEKITDLLEDYVEFLQENNAKNVSTELAAPELFFTMNRKIWHNKLVRKGIRKLDRIKGGELPITDDEIEKVYINSRTLRNKCLISLIGCLGIRPGAIADPVLRFKHLTPIEDSYAVRIYDESKDGYWAIIIPEARKDLDDYKQSRIRNGEIITEESPILTTQPSRWNKKYDHLNDYSVGAILNPLVKKYVKRKKIGRRYDKAITYMFRKRFNTKLKLENQVNSDVAELCMGHKLLGSQHTYTRPTMQQVYEAVKPAFLALTIDSTKRKQIELDQEREKNKEFRESVDEELFQRVIEKLQREKTEILKVGYS